MATYFSETSKSVDFPLVTDEIEYTDAAIPKKLQTYFLPNSLLTKHVIESWTGEENEVYDNAAEIYESMNYEEENELMGKPEVAINFKFERVEKNPTIMHHKLYFGKGEAVMKNGMKYTGDMQFSLMHGKGMLEGNGFKYIGSFRNSEIEGEGRYEWDKCFYEGEVKRGLRNGEGTLEFENGIVYSGQWREGLREGYGKIVYPSGQVYEGYWEKGKKHGQGMLKYSSGNYYEGSFLNDKQNGQGTIHWITTNEKYTGEWKDGQPHGFGIHIWLDSKGNKQLRNRYVGQWAFGKRNGHGEFYYANGSKYKGEWANDLKEGMGTMIFEDGSIYTGPFEKDRMMNRTLSGQVEVPAPTASVQIKKTANKTQNRIKEQPKPKEPNPIITTQRAKKNVEVNPYKNLIDISDITYNEEDSAKSEKEVNKILLQNNSDLKKWYEIYSTHIEAKEREESFTMCSKQLWRFLKDCAVISYKVSIANINRLFLRGSKNVFKVIGNNINDISTNEQTSLSRISSAVPQVPNLDISNIVSNHQESLSEEDSLDNINLDDVHNIDRPILFRQFAEAIVRAAYLKYSNGGKLFMDNVEDIENGEKYTVEKPKSQIGIALLKLFHEKLLKHGGKRTSKTPEEENEIEEGLNSLDAQITQTIFNKYSRKDRGNKEKNDTTISVQSILELLTDCKVSPDFIPHSKVIELIEKFHDPETSYTSIFNSDKSDKVKNRVLAKILGLELTYYEFNEVLVLIAIEITPKDTKNNDPDTSNVRISVERFLKDKIFNGLKEFSNKKPLIVTKSRIFPKSSKQIAIESKKEASRLETEKEISENKSMAEEDQRIS
jgi:hypothetical protein